jgi:SAM-dependent methyltransferase
MTKEIFDNIYKQSIWGYKSGPGSAPNYAMTWITQVNKFLDKEDIKTVLDIGCGDWRVGQKLKLENKQYTGIDISSVIIDDIKHNATNNIKFINVDIEEYDIPQTDLILIKDVLQHLPNSSIINIVNKIIKSCRYAIICNDISIENIGDIEPGGHRAINLLKEPFNFNFKEVDRWPVVKSPGVKVISLYSRDGDI